MHARYEAGRNIDPAAIDERGSSTPPGGTIEIPAGQLRPHLQLLDATRWFAARPAGLDAALGHVHPNSRMQPLVDGIDTFALMLDDLRAATGTGLWRALRRVGVQRLPARPRRRGEHDVHGPRQATPCGGVDDRQRRGSEVPDGSVLRPP